MKKFLLLASICVVIILLGSIITNSVNRETEINQEKVTIVTSFYPVYIATANIIDGIEDFELINLTENQTGCLHDYQMTTKDMKKLEKADLFIINGGGMEAFATDVAASYKELAVADSSLGISLMKEDYEHNHSDKEDSNESEKEHAHDHGEYNAHVWMNPSNYERQVDNIKEALIKHYPKYEKELTDNANQYIKKIDQMKQQMLTELSGPKNKEIIIFHDAFAYLADVLGLEVVDAIEMDSERALSAGEIANVVDEIRLHDIKLLFTEKQYSETIADAVESETDAKVYVLDSLVSGEMDKDAYLNGMKKNIEVLKQCLYD